MSSISTLFAFKFLDILSKKWTDLPAYKTGVIDEHGKVIVEKSKRNKEQKKSYGVFEKVVYNIKRIIEKLGGKSKLTSIASVMLLLKENLNEEEYNNIVESLYLLEEPVNTTSGIDISDKPIKKKKKKKMKRYSLNKDGKYVLVYGEEELKERRNFRFAVHNKKKVKTRKGVLKGTNMEFVPGSNGVKRAKKASDTIKRRKAQTVGGRSKKRSIMMKKAAMQRKIKKSKKLRKSYGIK